MTKLGLSPLIDPTADVRDCTLGRYTEVGARTTMLEVELGDYSYVVNDSDIAYTRIGKFTSIAAMTRINPGNHPMWRRASPISPIALRPVSRTRRTSRPSSPGVARRA